MTRTFLLVLATLVAGPALAGEPLTHDDLHQQDAKNTKQQTTDRRVEREDLHHSSAQTEICKCEMVAAQDVRLERGRFVVTEDQGGGASVEVIHDEEAVRKTADDDSIADDLHDTAKDIVEGAEEAVDDIEDSLD